MHEPSGLLFRLPNKFLSLVLGDSRKSSVEWPASFILLMSFLARIGPPSLQQRVAFRLHLNLNCFWLSFILRIVRVFGSRVRVAMTSFIVC